jgi:hypothetical protein
MMNYILLLRRDKYAFTVRKEEIPGGTAPVRSMICGVLLCAGALTGCGSSSKQLLGVPAALQQSSLLVDASAQEQMVQALILKAGFRPGTYLEVGSSNWKFVAQAGLVEVDILCDSYLATLSSFDREQRAGRQILTAAGAGTAAIMGLTGAAGVSIALVAAAFGLAANVFDAGTNSVLYTVTPTAVSTVAAKGRREYLKTVDWKRVTSRPAMMVVVQSYLKQCTPSEIEASINRVATGAPSVASSNSDIAIEAVRLASPSSSIVQDPQTFINTKVGGPSSRPPPVPSQDVPGGVAPAEQPFILSKRDVMRVQAALGMAIDGNLGAAGAGRETRRAIVEFRTGVLRRQDKTGTASDVLDQGTFEVLKDAGPLPAEAKTPFERGMLYDRASGFKTRDPVGFGRAIETLSGAPPTSTSVDGLPAELRAVRARREGINQPDALDARLYDILHPL